MEWAIRAVRPSVREAWEAMMKSGRKLGGMLVAIVRISQPRVARLVLNILNSGESRVPARDPNRGVYERGASCLQVITEAGASDIKVNINIPVFESHSVRRHSEKFIVVYSK